MMNDGALRREYAQSGSEDTFAELVRRHLDLVYSTALRAVNGDEPLAKDVSQSVFVDLARKASSLSKRPVLSGWLYTSACFAAAKAVRSERRRQAREQEANAMQEQITSTSEPTDWDKIRPVVDSVMLDLKASDREALLLRYFERRSLAEVGSKLGLSENAARMRVERALERLRERLTRRGVASSAAALALALAHQPAVAAPVGLAGSITAAALVNAATIGTNATITIMNWLNAKSIAAIAAATIVAGTGTYLLQQQNANRLSAANQSLLAEQEKLLTEREAARSAAKTKLDEPGSSQEDKRELLRLRGEIGLLRNENRQLRASVEKAGGNAPDSSADPERAVIMQRGRDAKIMAGALIMGYATHHDGQFPTNWVQAAPYLDEALRNDLNPGDSLRDVSEFLQFTNQFEILYQGKWDALTNLSDVVVLRENQPRQFQGKWVRAYSFADGHSQMVAEPAGGFDAWEREHGVQTTSASQ